MQTVALTARGPQLLLGAVLVALWAGTGRQTGADVTGYLMLAIPFTMAIQVGVLHRPLRQLWSRDMAAETGSRLRSAAVATALTLIIGLRALQSISHGTWIDDSWQVLVLAAATAVGYAVLRRRLVVVALAATAVTIAAWAATPHPATTGTGSGTLQTTINALRHDGALDGYGDLAVAEIDLNGAPTVRLAGLGATATTPMEIGSLTKAMTGMVIADSVRRGELDLDAPVSTHLPELAGSAAGTVTMRELVTHSSGFPSADPATIRRGLWRGPLGLGILTGDTTQTLHAATAVALTDRGHYSYSNLGAATAGQAAAAAAGTTYEELMRTRLFQPLGMTRTAIQATQPLVNGGRSASGLHVQPWAMSGYAPAGATVSTVHDLTILATAILDGTAPGLDALTPAASTDQPNTTIGDFWHISRLDTGQSVTWHNGQTGGYTSYLGLDLQHHRAVIVLSDVAKDVADLGIRLLTATASAPASRLADHE
jgi:CubicO group peptidase (beta-lactamase class C family)